MMQSEGKITRDNAVDIIKEFAKEYRRELGKVPGEIIIVGGGSIMLNYKFRDATQDFDVILKTASGVDDVIKKIADNYGLPRDWMNSDFKKTSSYSDALFEVSKHFKTLNNGTLEIRTVSGVYLIAMKLRAHRGYRNDVSDAIGVMFEEMEKGSIITFEDIKNAYAKLYNEGLHEQLLEQLKTICKMSLDELKEFYKKQNFSEQKIKGQVISYIDEGASINVRNVDEVVTKIREKMKSQEGIQ